MTMTVTPLIGKPTIGNEVDARLALELFESGDDDTLYLGSGYDRIAYLINDVVYKVNQHYNVNGREAEFLAAFVPVPPIAVPQWHLFNVDSHDVMAMEYIDGEATTDEEFLSDMYNIQLIPPNVVRHLERWGIVDYGDRNTLYKDGLFYLVDAGEMPDGGF